jgi:hypothetical protein
MKPGSIGAKQYFMRPAPLNRLHDVVKAPHPGGVGVNVGVACHLVDDAQVGAPVVGEAAEVGDDEVDVGVLGGEEFDQIGLSGGVVEEGDAKGAGGIADFAGSGTIHAVYFDTAKVPAGDGFGDRLVNLAFVALGMGEGKSDKPIGLTGDDAGGVGVGLLVVAMEGGEDYGFVNSSSSGTFEVGFHGRIGVPGACEQVSFSGVAMAIDDHGIRKLRCLLIMEHTRQ